MLVLLALVVTSCTPRFWKAALLVPAWVLGLAAFFVLMAGGVASACRACRPTSGAACR
jgi:hypothetical protein